MLLGIEITLVQDFEKKILLAMDLTQKAIYSSLCFASHTFIGTTGNKIRYLFLLCFCITAKY